MEIHWRNTQGHLNQMRGENAIQVFFAFIFIPIASKHSNCSIFLEYSILSSNLNIILGFTNETGHKVNLELILFRLERRKYEVILLTITFLQ